MALVRGCNSLGKAVLMSHSLDLCWRSGGGRGDLSFNCPSCQFRWLYILSKGLIEIRLYS